MIDARGLVAGHGLQQLPEMQRVMAGEAIYTADDGDVIALEAQALNEMGQSAIEERSPPADNDNIQSITGEAARPLKTTQLNL